MAMNLVTGYAGRAHITAEADGALNAGIVGKGRYVFEIGERFGYEVLSNNSIRIKSGYALDQGRLMELPINSTETLSIDNGLQSVKRCDIVAIRYSKNSSSGIESCELVIIKGTSGDDYADPALQSGDIIEGAEVDEMPLWRIKINGISIEAVEQMYTLSESFSSTTHIKSYGSLSDLGADTSMGISDIIQMMPSKSNLLYSVGSGNNNLTASLPSTSAGILIIEKTGSSSGRGYAMYIKLSNGDTYMNPYYNEVFGGWTKLLNEKDLPHIQSGVKDATTEGESSITINFPESFKEVPSVQITVASSAGITSPYGLQYYIKSVSKTKAVVNVKSGGGSVVFALHWVAMANY